MPSVTESHPLIFGIFHFIQIWLDNQSEISIYQSHLVLPTPNNISMFVLTTTSTSNFCIDALSYKIEIDSG